VADVEVDGAIERGGRASPRKIEQLISRQHSLRTFDQREEDVEFRGTEIDQCVRRRSQLSSGDV
jgi:hypothetical protein